ncbi:hypothetical protein [aff. Roholtiella sp. LEGE 12411]|uniref:hypothetical protein n=1 Tax=aff. Roholtiella sp. LEGE 12411 TaxID=1828822 RepID=UPI00187EE434|nr:hypothetical protein [aff. Roholtiella sp. LEGE 12411]MBE9037867.1 hypothetical protein [aff. Roholtiella sp. LEGE 12411]
MQRSVVLLRCLRAGYCVALSRKLILLMRSPSLLSSECYAYALSRKLVLLTRHHRDLGKVPGLLIEVVTV